MERIKDGSASQIPALLVYSTMTFLILRLLVFGFEMHFKSSDNLNPRSQIAWIDLTENFREKVIKDYSVYKKTPRFNEKDLCKKCRQRKLNSASINSAESPYKLDEEIPYLIGNKQKSVKFIIYEFYSANSDPCKTMEKSLSNSQVTRLIEKNFVPVRVTYNRNENVIIGKSLVDFRRKYNVCAFPTLVVVDGNGEMVANLVGSCSSLTTYRFLSRTVASMKGRSMKTKVSGNSADRIVSRNIQWKKLSLSFNFGILTPFLEQAWSSLSTISS